MHLQQSHRFSSIHSHASQSYNANPSMPSFSCFPYTPSHAITPNAISCIQVPCTLMQFQAFHAFISMHHNYTTFIHAFNAMLISYIAPAQFNHGPTHAIFLTCSIPMQCSSHAFFSMFLILRFMHSHPMQFHAFKSHAHFIHCSRAIQPWANPCKIPSLACQPE